MKAEKEKWEEEFDTWYQQMQDDIKRIEDGIKNGNDENYFQCPGCKTLFEKINCARCGREIWRTPWQETGENTDCKCSGMRSQISVHCGRCHQEGCVDCMPWDFSSHICRTDFVKQIEEGNKNET